MLFTYLSWLLFAIVPTRKPTPSLSVVLINAWKRSINLTLTVVAGYLFLTVARELMFIYLPGLYADGTMVPSLLSFI